MKNNQTFCLYEHIFPNGYVYTGITNNIYSRWGYDGIGYKQNEKMFSAINEFSWENVQHLILKYALTEEEAKIEEKNRIQENIKNGKRIYNSCFNYGENDSRSSYFCPEVLRIINLAITFYDTERLGRYYKLFGKDINKAMAINVLHSEIIKTVEYKDAVKNNNDVQICTTWFKKIKEASMLGSVTIELPSDFIPNF